MSGLLDSVAGNLLGRIIEAVSRPAFRDIRSELRNLETTVSILKAGLRNAEEKQAELRNAAEKQAGLGNAEEEQARYRKFCDLLKKLKDAFSMADSLIEELECDYLKWRVQNRKNDADKKGCQFSSCFSSNFLVSPSKTAARISQITKNLDMIEENMSEFKLVEDDNEYIKRLKGEMTLRTSITGSQVFGRLLHLRKEAILSYNVDIIGRDEVKKSIIGELVKDEDKKQKSPLIFSIHGDGGMGKTALAKFVYNAHEVFAHFDKRIWVCVSEDFNIQRIRREVLSSATGENVSDSLTGKLLQNRLQRYFFGKKFLLVLDDFGALDPNRVSELEEIVKMDVKGSKIMITTRSQETLNDSMTHKIDKLDEKTSMDLFEHTFGSNVLSDDEELKELVGKCGPPLAIKCLAGLLSSKLSDGAECLNVKDLSEKWNQEKRKDGDCVLRALKLSYDLMPSYLKPCFLCFSLLPKDNVFYSFELIQLWMAQGILHSGDKDPEAVGRQYFDELRSRCLLEDVEEHTLGYWFKIHSLVHDLAVQQAKEQKNLENFHQLSFVDCNNKDFPPSTSYDDIRFLSIPVGGGVEPKINRGPLFKCITKFRQLRFLYLCNSSLEEIPTSIDMLKHLRYLDLRGSQKLKRLPESICKLQSLQTLILAFCSELEELPRNIKNMISLRFLWIQTKQTNLGKDGIGSLTSLRFLAIGGSEKLTHLFEDIDKLNCLQTLIIYDCKSLLTLPEGLENLSSLCNMAIWGCERLRFTFSLESLRLQKLILRGLTAVATLPKWMYNFDETLEVLEIGEFPKLRELPFWLSNFWELRILGISNCPRLEPDCMPSDLDYCDEMEELRITFCGSMSRESMENDNHEDMHIDHIPTIYVDSKKIKPQVESIDKHEATGGDGQHLKAEHEEQTGRAKQDDANDNKSRPGTGQPLEAKHDEQTVREKQDDAIDNRSHPGTGQPLKAEHDEQTDRAKRDDANDNKSYIGTGQPLQEGHEEQTVGAKHDDANNNKSYVGTRQPLEAKRDEPTVGAKPDDANKDNKSHVGTGQPFQAEHDEQTVGAKQDDANDNKSRVGIGKTTGVKQDGITEESHVEDKQTIEGKKDGTTDDSHVGVGQIEGAKHDEETNKKHVEGGKMEGANLGETNENGHGKVCLGDNDHTGADQATVVTYEGF